MNITVEYIPLIITTGHGSDEKPAAGAAKCQVCKNIEKQDDISIYCKVLKYPMEKTWLIKKRYWCPKFEYDPHKHKKLL